MNRAILSAFVVVLFSAMGCNHAVGIRMADNTPADISVDGQNLGKAPVTYNESPGMKDSTYQIEAKKPDGTVVKMEGKRTETGSMEGAGVGAGIGAAACLGLNCAGGAVFTVLGFVGLGFLGIPVGCVGCAALVAGPIAGYVLVGRSPDTVVVGGPGVAPAPAAPAAPVAPTPAPLGSPPLSPAPSSTSSTSSTSTSSTTSSLSPSAASTTPTSTASTTTTSAPTAQRF
jgi:hypothetical protein